MGWIDQVADAVRSVFDSFSDRFDAIERRVQQLEDRQGAAPALKEKWPPYKGHEAEVETKLLGKRVKIEDGSYALVMGDDGSYHEPYIAWRLSEEFRDSWEVVAEHCRLPTGNGHQQAPDNDLGDSPFNDIILRSDDGLVVFSQARFVNEVK